MIQATIPARACPWRPPARITDTGAGPEGTVAFRSKPHSPPPLCCTGVLSKVAQPQYPPQSPWPVMQNTSLGPCSFAVRHRQEGLVKWTFAPVLAKMRANLTEVLSSPPKLQNALQWKFQSNQKPKWGWVGEIPGRMCFC